MATLASDWLIHFRLLLWKPLNGIQHPLPSLCFSESIGKTRWPSWPLIGWDIFDFSSVTAERNSTKLDRKEDHTPSTKSVFFGGSEKQNGRPGLWLAETFSTSPLKPVKVIQRNLTESKISTSSTKFVFIGPIGKTKWPPWHLIGWDIFDFSSETAERNSTKLDRKQDINAHYEVCVYQVDRKNKMATLASDWLRHFDFFSETAERSSTKLDRNQVLNVLNQVCVFGADQNNMAAMASDWLRHILTFPLKLLNGIQRNLTGSKISMSSTKFVFIGLKSK